MLKYNLDDTIAAISTPIGQGGIGIIRLSGKEALAVADKIFTAKDGKERQAIRLIPCIMAGSLKRQK